MRYHSNESLQLLVKFGFSQADTNGHHHPDDRRYDVLNAVDALQRGGYQFSPEDIAYVQSLT